MSSAILAQSSGLSAFLRKPLSKLMSGPRRHAPFTVMNSKCAFTCVSSHVRRSSGWIFFPLHMHVVASVGRQYLPVADATLSSCSARAPEMLLETKNCFRPLLPVTSDLSTKDGSTLFFETSHLSKTPGTTIFPVTHTSRSLRVTATVLSLSIGQIHQHNQSCR